MKKQNAFTLIELLIAMSILLVMLGVSINQYQTYERRNNLILMADSAKAFIQSAQNEAMSRVYSDSTSYSPTNCNKIIVKTDPERKTLSEYRLIDKKPVECKIPAKSDNQLVINTATNGITVTKDVVIEYLAPKGTIDNISTLTPLELNNGHEQITITVNEKSITTDRTGF